MMEKIIGAVYFAYFESFIVYRNSRRPRYVSKKTAAFGSCERFHNVRACRCHNNVQ